MDTKIKENYNLWLTNVKDKKLLKELRQMNDSEIENAFYSNLSFGTAGLRGVMSAGTNRVNIYTIALATQAYSNWLLKQNAKSAVVCYDPRINSKLFAQITATVLAENGIKVFMFKDVMPTPFCSFSIRHLKADGGVMVTSSHNTKEYNGYKAYKNTGCQVTGQDAKDIEKEMLLCNPFAKRKNSFKYYVKNGTIIYADEILKDYLNAVKAQQINKIENIRICYSALYGCGYKIVPQLFNQITKVPFFKVKEQSKKDGTFKTCPSPNPEKTPVLELGIKTAQKNNCDILLLTDPDADRLGIAVKHNNEFIHLNGNEMAVLISDYLLTQLKAAGRLPKKPIIITSLVTTPFIDVVAKSRAAVHRTLIGFASLGGKMDLLTEQGQENNIVLTCEESIGFLIGTYARDKDGIVAAMMFAEAASYYKAQGKTLIDVLNDLYKKYGCAKNYSANYTFTGIEGTKKIAELMNGYRKNKITSIAGLKVLKITDYLKGVGDVPKANIIEINLEGNGRIMIRPSGTEPLIKFYITLLGNKAEEHYKNILKWINL